jgi:hypothetical protein
MMPRPSSEFVEIHQVVMNGFESMRRTLIEIILKMFEGSVWV